MSRSSIIAKVVLTLCLLAFVPLADAAAGGKTVTFYLDGTRVEQELAVDNSVVEIPLPLSIQPGSLRVKPLGATRISRVEALPLKPGKSLEKEMARLNERREELRDRLKALGVKEEIYKAAAKSQGSKAPRRTRTNPEPLSSIRQGTDFAITRLEEVYRATRKTELELKEIERKHVSLRRNSNIYGSYAKVSIDGKRGRVRVSYLTTGEGWTPSYDIRLSGGGADVTLMAMIPGTPKGDSCQVVPMSVSGADQSPIPVVAGSMVKVASYRLTVLSEKRLQTVQNAVTVTLRNDAGVYLPPGDANGFWQGEFLGHTSFSGLRPAESVILTFGASEEKNNPSEIMEKR